MKLSVGLLIASFLLILVGIVDRQDDWFALALFPATFSLLTYVVALKARLASSRTSPKLEARLAEIEQRLSWSESELDVATRQIELLRAERDFDRELLRLPVGEHGALSVR